jgi:hypothetical protein
MNNNFTRRIIYRYLFILTIITAILFGLIIIIYINIMHQLPINLNTLFQTPTTMLNATPNINATLEYLKTNNRALFLPVTPHNLPVATKEVKICVNNPPECITYFDYYFPTPSITTLAILTLTSSPTASFTPTPTATPTPKNLESPVIRTGVPILTLGCCITILIQIIIMIVLLALQRLNKK